MSLESRKLAVASSPHVSSPIGTRSLMLDVLIALVPALCIGIWFFGPRALTMTVVSVLACEIFEYGYRKLLKKTNTCGDLSAAITGSIITRYEDAISAVPLLVAFLPMLMDTGGNCGSQSATLVIRGLALEEIRPRDALRVIRKELAVAAIVSAVLAAANGLRIYLQYHDSAIALVISLSLAATVVLAKLVGCMLPIAAKQLHMDPAIMASPLITTIVDAGAVLIYFQAAAALLRLPV